MAEKKNKQKKPLNQKEVEEMLDKGDSFEGLEIGDVDFSDRIFKNHINFSGANFVGIANFQHASFLNRTNFSGTEFSGDRGADFMDSDFSGDSGVDFLGAIFSGKGGADFSGTEFSADEDANFFAANFSGNGGANFMDAKFYGKGAANFGDTIFSGEKGTNFNGARFYGKGADFSGSEFSAYGGVSFLHVKFSGERGANFGWATFSGEGGANFMDAKFYGKGRTNFMYSKFSGNGGVIFKSALFSSSNGVKFTGAEFLCEDRISFEDVTFNKECIIHFDSVIVKNPKNLYFRNAYLGNTSFFQTDVEDFNFKNVKFNKFPHDNLNWFKKNILIHRAKLIDEIWNDTAPEDDQREYNEQYYSQVEIIYRQLKRNFEEHRDYAKAGDFHFGEMEMKRIRQSKYKKYISLTAFYKYFSGYGQKWTRALFWFSSFVALFMFLNLNWLEPIYKLKIETINNGNISLEAVYVPPTYIDSFIYTFKTMTLREDKRFEIPDPIGSLFVLLQSALGPAILALMLLAIRRQFRR